MEKIKKQTTLAALRSRMRRAGAYRTALCAHYPGRFECLHGYRRDGGLIEIDARAAIAKAQGGR